MMTATARTHRTRLSPRPPSTFAPRPILQRNVWPQVLTTIKAYPVETDVVIVTNKPRHMLNYRSSFFSDDATFRVVNSENKSDPYGLAWAHRDIATTAMAEGKAPC